MKTELLNGKMFTFGNENDLLELFFTETTNKFHIMFNAKTMHTSKTFVPAKNEVDRLCKKHSLKAQPNI